MKKIVIICPHIHKKELSFQLNLYEEWIKTGVRHKKSNCPAWRWLFHIVRRICFPRLCEISKEAHVVFVGGGSINWGAWPDYMFYEIIPIIWDCWPIYFDKVFRFIEKNKVRTVVVTSRQVAEILKERFSYLNVLAISEGINISFYMEGDLLVNRKIDLLEYGRQNQNIPNLNLSKMGFVHLKSNGRQLFPNEQSFIEALSNTKVTLAFPRCVTNPEIAGNIETLTQRYWENMLSRVVMVGKAPSELIDLIGYNPVVDIDPVDSQNQLYSILNNIDSYQELVDKNRQVAIKYSTWMSRIETMSEFFKISNYSI